MNAQTEVRIESFLANGLAAQKAVDQVVAGQSKAVRSPTTLAHLFKGAHFTFPNEPDKVWLKTGQRSARRCHYIKQRVVRFHGWEPVTFYENPEVV